MRNTTTSRAGSTGDIAAYKSGDKYYTSDYALQAKGGFGVFATYTKNLDYDASEATKLPNFMFNQAVTMGEAGEQTGADAANAINVKKWTYSPVKYWPNGLNDQAGAVGGDDGTLTAGGKVSFFAYGPYVAKSVADGSGSGIIGMSNDDDNTHPTITYKKPDNGAVVDVLWGTIPAAGSGNILNGTMQNGATLTGGKGPVNVNLTKQQIDGTVNFLFKHALAKVGGSSNDGVTTAGLQIMLDIDALSGGTEDNNTKVTVESIKINTDFNRNGNVTDDGEKFSNQGELDLATGVWTLSDEAANQVGIDQVINTAGTTPTGASQLNPTIAEPGSTPARDASGFSSLPEGVKVAPKNVYADGQENSPLIFFPGQTPKLNIQITYVVRTSDNNLNWKYSEVKQTVAKTITFPAPVEMNKKYGIMIHLGLTSVKFTAAVADWDAQLPTGDWNSDGTTDDGIVNLPLNVE